MSHSAATRASRAARCRKQPRVTCSDAGNVAPAKVRLQILLECGTVTQQGPLHRCGSISRLLRFSNTASFHTDRTNKGIHWLSVDRVLSSARKSTNPGLKATTWRSQMHRSQRTDTRARTDAKGTAGYVHPHVVPGVCTSNGRATLKQTPHSGGMLHRNFKRILSHCNGHQQYIHNRTHRPT